MHTFLPLTYFPHYRLDFTFTYRTAPSPEFLSFASAQLEILPSPYGRGAAVFEAGAENYGCGEGAILSSRKSKNRKDINFIFNIFDTNAFEGRLGRVLFCKGKD